MLRRGQHEIASNTAVATINNHDRLKIDLIEQLVLLDGREIRLTPLEYRLLKLLASNQNQAISNQKIRENIWGEDFNGNPDIVRIYVQRLRSKLDDNPPRIILNEHGSGYLFNNN